MIKVLAAILLLCGATCADAAQKKSTGRFTKGRMSTGPQDSAFGRRWGRGRTSLTGNSHRATDPKPQDFGMSAPVAGAKVQHLGFTTEPGGPFGKHEVDAGTKVAYEEGKSRSVETAPSVFKAPPDKLPPATPGSGGSGGSASGANAITANGPLTPPPSNNSGQ